MRLNFKALGAALTATAGISLWDQDSAIFIFSINKNEINLHIYDMENALSKSHQKSQQPPKHPIQYKMKLSGILLKIKANSTEKYKGLNSI